MSDTGDSIFTFAGCLLWVYRVDTSTPLRAGLDEGAVVREMSCRIGVCGVEGAVRKFDGGGNLESRGAAWRMTKDRITCEQI